MGLEPRGRRDTASSRGLTGDCWHTMTVYQSTIGQDTIATARLGGSLKEVFTVTTEPKGVNRMATRNERKARAKARLLQLQEAVSAAFEIEAEKAAREARFAEYALYAKRESVVRKSYDRTGRVEARAGKRKFVARDEAVYVPLKGDGATGRGEKRKRWI
jgi:hypothetical protein